MKSIYQNTVKAGLLGAAVLLGFTACTDDHFDIQPSTVSGSNTIWQNVEANADLDSVAMILRRCKVMKSQTDKSAKQTYAELLATSQQLTAWLPKNGTFNAKQYLDELDSAAVLRAKDEMAGTRAEYDVANRFARNHIARFNYESNMGEQRIALMNSKIVNYNAGEGTFNGVKLDAANANILSSNGMLHVLDGESQFAYNIFERLQVDSRFAKIYGDIDKYNVYTFSSSSSTQGSMNHNGSMEYVDSVWTRTNSLMTDARLTYLTDEDSLYVSVIPTDAAYEAARQKIHGLFKYAKNYNYAWDASKRDWTNKGTNALKFNTDSLTTYNVTSGILSASSFSVGYNSEGPVTTSNPQAFLNHVLTADSLNSSADLVIYNKDKGNVNPIFDGQTADDAIKASNGYILLIKAEAIARSLPSSTKASTTKTDAGYALVEGFNLVNAIFARCNPKMKATDSYGKVADLRSDRLRDDYATHSGNVKSADDLLKLVYNERQREFVAEGKRWFDIVRQCEATNANTDVLTNYITLSTTVRNRLKALYSLYNPIYSEEMKVNGVDYGGKLEQNPVWKRYSDN